MAAKTVPGKKKGKGKLVLLLVFLLLLGGGGGAGFAFFKKIGPFAVKTATPKTEKPKVAAKPAPKPAPSAPTTTVKTLPPTTKVDPDEGAAKLAKLWNELDAPKLLAIAKDWREPDLARVTTKMDAGKVAELLSAMPPKRASALSREMQRIASIVSVDD